MSDGANMRRIETFQTQSADFVQVVELDGLIVSLRITFNTRSETWFINEYIELDTGKSLYGIKITKDFPLLWPLKSRIDLSGDFITVRRDDKVDDNITYDNLNNGWDLYYITNDEFVEWKNEHGV